jgi:hypothetical protein
MLTLAQDYFYFEVILLKDMIDALTKHGIVYEKNQSELNIKGVFVGVNWRL